MLKIAVEQYKPDGTFIRRFESIAEAARLTHSNSTGITDACKGNYKTANGFVWKYADGGTGVTSRKEPFAVRLEPLKKNVENYVAYENLANAIVTLAANDLKTVLKAYKWRADRERALKKSGIVDFFYSGWYRTLTTIDGDYIVKKLKAEIWNDDN